VDETIREPVSQGRLKHADLIVDRIYEGGRGGNAGDDPLNALLGVSNQGGFRILGKRNAPRLIVLTTSLANRDWPDFLDLQTGRFTYYGDNKNPGSELHDTGRYGNHLLRSIFEWAHSGVAGRSQVPPILLFSSAGNYRDVRFLGLVVPGEEALPFTDDLVAIWKSTSGLRFQNYRAIFTILNVPTISRVWLDALRNDSCDAAILEPAALTAWRTTDAYEPLKAEKTILHRSRSEQEPVTENHKAIVNLIFQTFRSEPVRFERCAGRISEMLLGHVTKLDITRPSRDGGRDGIGMYRVGGPANGIEVEFAIEAKCYAPDNSVGVKEISRLISRLRHRQFGLLITTSHLGSQAYQEIKDDAHPIIIVAARDIAELLESKGLGERSALTAWLGQF